MERYGCPVGELIGCSIWRPLILSSMHMAPEGYRFCVFRNEEGHCAVFATGRRAFCFPYELGHVRPIWAGLGDLLPTYMYGTRILDAKVAVIRDGRDGRWGVRTLQKQFLVPIGVPSCLSFAACLAPRGVRMTCRSRVSHIRPGRNPSPAFLVSMILRKTLRMALPMFIQRMAQPPLAIAEDCGVHAEPGIPYPKEP